MDAIIECCAGLDVHRASVVACVNKAAANQRSQKTVRTFGTTRVELEQLRDWLLAEGCSLAAMESTGIYWRPVYAMLEGHLDLIVGNAQHMKTVPGRKTDVKDCDWISDLARHGLIARSFVPPRPIRALRDLTRYRRKLSQAQATERNRLIKLLESANIKLSGLISDVFGVSGQAMLLALIEGKQTPEEMAQHARRRMRRKIAALAQALDGTMDEHHRFLLGKQFNRIKAAEADLEEIDGRIRQMLAPYAKQMRRLMKLPGVDWVTAATIIAEIGVDMSAFHSAEHLASWASEHAREGGICPGNNRSAGKQRSGRVRKGNLHLKAALVTAAVVVAKQRGTFWGEKHRRLRARRGELRAHVAIAHKILAAVYHVLASDTDYVELGPSYLDRIDDKRTVRHLARRIEELGYSVDIKPKAA
jgi:transposase